MDIRLLEKAFNEFLNVEGVDYAVIDTDSYGDCNTCVNHELAEEFGYYSSGIYLKHWNEGMNATGPISELDKLFIAHDITEEQAQEFYDIFSKYFTVEPQSYDPHKAFMIKNNAVI